MAGLLTPQRDKTKGFPVNRKFLWNLFKYVLAFGLLAFVVWRNWQPGSETGLQHVWNKHAVEGKPIAFGSLALGFSLLGLSTLVTFIRWYYLVRAQDLPFEIKDAMRLGLIGCFFNTFLPGSVGGDVVKAAGIARGQKRRTVAVATVIMDRIIALWAMIMMIALLGVIFKATGLIEGIAATRIIRAACIIVAVSVIVWFALGYLPQERADRLAARLSHIRRVGHSLAELWRTIWMYRCRQRTVYYALFLTWIGQIGFGLGFYYCALTLWDPNMGAVPGIAEHYLIVPIGLVIQAAPLFPGGAGIGEAGFGGLYSVFGSTVAMGVLASLVYRISTWAFAILGFFIAQRMQTQPAREVEPEPERCLQPTCETSAAV